MNIGVADDHAKQRFGLYQNGGDPGGESLEAISWRVEWPACAIVP
jgi:hypothetical protein